MNELRPIQYKKIQRTWDYKGFSIALQTIEDLDDAIDQLCLSDDLDDLTLKERENLCPYFGILWPSAEGLCHLLLESYKDLNNKKILEIGCGLGLPSIILRKLKLDVLATDFHPDVEAFFQENCRLNDVVCAYEQYDWTKEELPFGKFDVVVGSDILYEGSHAKDVAQALRRLIKPRGKIFIADPGRGYLQNFVGFMEDEGFKYDLHPVKIGKDEIFTFVFHL